MKTRLNDIAKEFVDKLLADLDVKGSHHQPDLRDSISDEREWLEDQIAELLEDAVDELR
jgi:hypothetical protein